MTLNVLSCNICMEPYTMGTVPQDRRPYVICANGHTVCSTCLSRLFDCPTCRDPKTTNPILNRALLEVLESLTPALINIPEIPLTDLELQEKPFAQGGYSEVFDAKWYTQNVVLKQIRIHPQDRHIEQLKLETSLAMSLHHPNIIKVFGLVKMPRNQFGIVMEKADVGCLNDAIGSLSFQQKIVISLGVVDGLAYLHSKKVAHRDLKPENILLFGSQPTSKISDFGTSKILQTIVKNTAMVGTPKYVAPELLGPSIRYGHSVDIYSLSVTLYELFSGKSAFEECTSPMEIMLATVQGRRPEFTTDFPKPLAELIQQGWGVDALRRPGLDEFRNIILAMKPKQMEKEPHPAEARISVISATQQCAEVAKESLPVTLISMNWDSACDADGSDKVRHTMVHNMRTVSNMSDMINESVLLALDVVPRHLFLQESRLPAFLNTTNIATSKKLEASYAYNRPIPATAQSNESSPEIIGTQLSLVKISPGNSVLLVGAKGGYIQSLVAQIVGINGCVVTVSSRKTILDICRNRVNDHCPLRNTMQWVVVDDVKDAAAVQASLDTQFHAIVYCGAVDVLPTDMIAALLNGGGLLAPVKINKDQQQLQLLMRIGRGQEIRKITKFGVIFEDVK